VERTDGSRVAEVEAGKETDATGETHDTGKDIAGDTGGRDALHEGHSSGDRGAECHAVEVVAGTGVGEDTLEVAGEDDVLIGIVIEADGELAGLRVTINELLEVSVMVIRRGIGRQIIQGKGCSGPLQEPAASLSLAHRCNSA
jgi:hypothetical protein